MTSTDANRIEVLLMQRVRDGADAACIAAAVTATWRAIGAALTPVLGQRGVEALFRRSLHLVGATYPWLMQHEHAPSSHAPPDLTESLTQQPADVAAAGGAALLHTLHELLSSLIGAALTDQLLRSVWTHLSGGLPAQDISP